MSCRTLRRPVLSSFGHLRQALRHIRRSAIRPSQKEECGELEIRLDSLHENTIYAIRNRRGTEGELPEGDEAGSFTRYGRSLSVCRRDKCQRATCASGCCDDQRRLAKTWSDLQLVQQRLQFSTDRLV